MEVTVIKHKDVRGKELNYLRIKNEYGEVLINVGNKTYEEVEKLQKAKEVKNDNKMEKPK